MTQREIDERRLDQAWRILDHNRAFNMHFDFKFGPILVVGTAVVALVGGLLKDNVHLLGKTPLGWAIVVVTLLCLWSIFMSVFHVLAGTSPSLTLRDTAFNPVKGVLDDGRPTSLIFFNDIAEEVAGFRDDPTHPIFAAILSQRLNDPDDLYRDLAEQIAEIAAITRRKALNVRKAAVWLFYGTVCGGITLILVLAAGSLTPVAR